nr:MAG TPA: hypothetical protein [Caudoviricetes sp.]
MRSKQMTTFFYFIALTLHKVVLYASDYGV